jgi:hypothetical protein
MNKLLLEPVYAFGCVLLSGRLGRKDALASVLLVVSFLVSFVATSQLNSPAQAYIHYSPGAYLNDIDNDDAAYSSGYIEYSNWACGTPRCLNFFTRNQYINV